ncbi:MAG TPA: TonB-dependent receptor [Bacteroidales bacterium]|nr:TonB-dependent receptor [Bacteroidales bacterium]
MGRSFLRSCEGAVLFLFFFTTTIYGQEKADTSLYLNEVVVTASRVQVAFSQALRAVDVSTRTELRLAAADNAAGILETATGADIRQRGAPGQQADLSIRGGSFDQTLVLINGVNVSDPQTGHHNMDLPFDMSAVQRMELLMGPAARIFGPNAFNGVVNVIVKEPSENEVSARFSAGSYKYNAEGLSFSVRKRSVSDFFAAGRTASDGYIDNTDFRNMSFFNRMALSAGAKKLELQTGYSSKAFGANSFYSPKFPNQYEETQTIFASLRTEVVKGVAPVFYWRRHYDCFQLFRDNAPSWYTGHNYHRTDVFGSDMNYVIGKSGHFSTSAGYNFRYEAIVSNKLGEELGSSKPVAGADGVYYSYGARRYNAGVLAEESFSDGRWSLTGGALLNFFSGADRKKITIYPGLDAGYSLSGATRLYASINRTLRQPTFTDLYYNDAVSVGNPGLHPEKAWAFEAGVKYDRDGFNGRISLFERLGKDMIDWVRPADEEKWHVMNFTEVNISGLEVTGQYDFERNCSRFLKSIRAGYAWLYADKSSRGYQSKYLLDILRNKADIVFTHYIGRKITACWSASWQDRAGGFIRYSGGVAGTSESPFSDVFLLDGKMVYSCKRFQVFVEAVNMAGVKYYDVSNVEQPGRWFRAGIECNLKKAAE